MKELYIDPNELPPVSEVPPVRVVDQKDTAILAMAALNHTALSLYGVVAGKVSEEVGVPTVLDDLHGQLGEVVAYKTSRAEFSVDEGEVVARAIAVLAIQSPSALRQRQSTAAFSSYVLNARYFLTHRD